MKNKILDKKTKEKYEKCIIIVNKVEKEEKTLKDDITKPACFYSLFA